MEHGNSGFFSRTTVQRNDGSPKLPHGKGKIEYQRRVGKKKNQTVPSAKTFFLQVFTALINDIQHMAS